MLVYRVEKENGEGPYVNTHIPHVSSHTSRHFDTHPNPYMEGISFTDKDFCGFESVASLKAWFDTCNEPLHSAGYSMSIYSVSKRKVKFGTYQLVFQRDKAKLRKRIPLWQDVPSWYRC